MDKSSIIGQTVEHKAYGRGTIVDYDGSHVKVEFKNKTSDFQCPKAFYDGFLVADRVEVHDALVNAASEQVERETEEREKLRIEEEQRKEEEKKNRGIRGKHKDTVSKGESFRTHADALNSCFGYNYKHYQPAFKRIDDKYAAWFPSIAKRVMGEYVAADTGNGWLNVLCENDTIIMEKNIEDANRNIERSESHDRLVFAKMDGETYTFIGLFRSNPVPTKEGFRHELLGTVIDLNTMRVIK